MCRFLEGVEFGAVTVATPDLSRLAKVVEGLSPEERAKYYAGFLDIEGASGSLRPTVNVPQVSKPASTS